MVFIPQSPFVCRPEADGDSALGNHEGFPTASDMVDMVRNCSLSLLLKKPINTHKCSRDRRPSPHRHHRNVKRRLPTYYFRIKPFIGKILSPNPPPSWSSIKSARRTVVKDLSWAGSNPPPSVMVTITKSQSTKARHRHNVLTIMFSSYKCDTN